MIDKNGPAKTGGTGIKQLRENIAESKLSYEIMDDAAQVMIISIVVFIVWIAMAIMMMIIVMLPVTNDEGKDSHSGS